MPATRTRTATASTTLSRRRSGPMPDRPTATATGSPTESRPTAVPSRHGRRRDDRCLGHGLGWRRPERRRRRGSRLAHHLASSGPLTGGRVLRLCGNRRGSRRRIDDPALEHGGFPGQRGVLHIDLAGCDGRRPRAARVSCGTAFPRPAWTKRRRLGRQRRTTPSGEAWRSTQHPPRADGQPRYCRLRCTRGRRRLRQLPAAVECP